jgi:hypothetical protein
MPPLGHFSLIRFAKLSGSGPEPADAGARIGETA